MPVKHKHKINSIAALTARDADETQLTIAIGKQVRSFRNHLNMTVAEAASKAGISSGMLSKIENGNASPSLSSLHALSRVFNVPFTSFFRKYEERQSVSYVRADAGEIVERRGTRIGHEYQLLSHGTGKNYSVAPHLITFTDKTEVFPLFHHAGEEFIYMLEGEMVYKHADESFVMAPGDSLFFDAEQAHGPSQLTRLPIRFISVITQPRGDQAQ